VPPSTSPSSQRHRPARQHQTPPRRRPPGPQPLDSLVDHLHGLIGELHDVVAGRVYKYHQDAGNVFDLRELAVHAEASAAFLAEYVDELAEATQIVHDDVPLATTYGTGNIWTGRQLPRYVLRLATFDQHRDLPAGIEQCPRDGGADEAGRARDQSPLLS
jgi:hypothetical protein